MILAQGQLKLISQYALAVIATVSITFNVYQHIDRIKHDEKDVNDYKEVVRYKDKLIEDAQEQRTRSDEIEKASRLLKQ